MLVYHIVAVVVFVVFIFLSRYGCLVQNSWEKGRNCKCVVCNTKLLKATALTNGLCVCWRIDHGEHPNVKWNAWWKTTKFRHRVLFVQTLLCLCVIAEAESVKVTEMTSGGIELKELLKEYTATSDYEDDEFELNIYGKRWYFLLFHIQN